MTKNYVHAPRNDLLIVISLIWDEAWTDSKQHCTLPEAFNKSWAGFCSTLKVAENRHFNFLEPLGPIVQSELAEWYHLVAACRKSGINDGRASHYMETFYNRPRLKKSMFLRKEINPKTRSMKELRQAVSNQLDTWLS